jgi:hypothetical protein
MIAAVLHAARIPFIRSPPPATRDHRSRIRPSPALRYNTKHDRQHASVPRSTSIPCNRGTCAGIGVIDATDPDQFRLKAPGSLSGAQADGRQPELPCRSTQWNKPTGPSLCQMGQHEPSGQKIQARQGSLRWMAEGRGPMRAATTGWRYGEQWVNPHRGRSMPMA